MARMWCGARYYCLFAMVVRMERLGATETIPPVVARILSGDSTSPLTREARVVVQGEGLLSFYNGCEDGKVGCNGRGKPTPLRKERAIVRMQNRISTHRRSPYEKRG